MERQLNLDLQKMAGKGLRTVAIAFKPTKYNTGMTNSQRSEVRSSKIRSDSHIRDDVEEIEKRDFVLLGIFGIEDMPRPESK